MALGTRPELIFPCAENFRDVIHAALETGMASSQHHLPSPAADHFSTTQWSAVFLAGAEPSPAAHHALEVLCRCYWIPLYAYVRRQGYAVADAQDLTQDFFARLLEGNFFRLADPQRGRFRTFLLSSLKNFLISEWTKTRAQKRGGGAVFISWDAEEAEGRYLAEPEDGLTPEKIFERRWAMALLEKVLARLHEHYTGDGREPLFHALKPYVWGESPTEGYAQIATRLNLSEGALRVAMHRLRESFRRLLREEVGRTVASPAEIDGELRELVAALRS